LYRISGLAESALINRIGTNKTKNKISLMKRISGTHRLEIFILLEYSLSLDILSLTLVNRWIS
jgi:hypothetical protein